MGKFSRNLVLVFCLLMVQFILAAGANAAYIISSLNFQISPSATTAKIGDYILFRMCVVDATDTFQNVTVNSVTNTSIVVSSPDFNGIFPLYVYDGARTWQVNSYTSSSLKTVTLSDTNLTTGQPPLGNGYAALQYADFNASTGVLAAGGTASLDIGTAVYGIPMYDDGLAAHNDTGALPDGVYGARFQVRESYQFNMTNAAIVGKFTKNTVKASNSPFTTANRINIDGVRPKIDLVNASPNPYNPNKQLLQYFYYLSEGAAVTCTLLDSVGNTVIVLSAEGTSGYNNPMLWDGLDSNGTLMTDGDYWYRFETTDAVGNTGLAFVGKLKLTTVELLASVYSVDAEYIQTSQEEVVVTLHLETLMTNATQANLANLGFDYAPFEVPGVSHNYKNYPWQYMDIRMYDAQGAIVKPVSKDYAPSSDTDTIYINTLLDPTFIDGLPLLGFTAQPKPTNACGGVNTATVYTTGDNKEDNDWDNVFSTPFIDQGGGVFKANPVHVYHATQMTPGTYIAAFKAVLVGKSIISVSKTGPSSSTMDCVSGTTVTTYTITTDTYHAMPSYFYDDSWEVTGDERGYGLASNDRTVSFVVEQNPSIPGADSTPPTVVANSEYPSANSVKEPGVINPSNYMKVTLTDAGVGAGPVNLSKFSVKDPYGNPVQGHVAWNAGTPGTKLWEIYYIPDNPLTLGGIYTMKVIPIDAAYNIGEPVEFDFEINDTSIPQASNMTAMSGAGVSMALTEGTTTQLNFLVSSLEVALIPGGTAAIDWTNCSISVSGTTGTSSHESGTNIVTFTPATTLADGQYTVYVTATSANGYSGVYTYTFYVTTAGMVYVNLSGTGENVNTCMRISSFDAAVSGITDNNGTAVPANQITVATQTGSQYPPSGYTIVGNTVAFSAGVTYQLPLTFNNNFCMVTLRMHYTDAHIAALLAAGKTAADLTVWYWNGTTWTQITTIGTPIDSGTDHYIDVSLQGLPANNKYALMYQTPVAAPAAFHFDNTKAFNPTDGPAVVYYADSITGITEAKVYIYNLTGSLVRTLQTSEVANAANYGSDPLNPATIKYFFSWDGRNDRGALVRNGIYAVKIALRYGDGTTSAASRLIAVVK